MLFYFHQWKSILTRSRQWFSFKGNGALQFSLRICVSDENIYWIVSQQIQELFNWENNLFTVKYELLDGLLLTAVNSLVRWIVPSTQSQLKPRKQWKDCFVLYRNIFFRAENLFPLQYIVTVVLKEPDVHYNLARSFGMWNLVTKQYRCLKKANRGFISVQL